MLAGLVEAYVTAINNGAVPTIATAWQGVAEAESRRAADAAEAAYAATFNEGVPAEEAALEAEHQHALLAAQRAFDEVAVGDETVRRANEERFRAACEARWVHYQGEGMGAGVWGLEGGAGCCRPCAQAGPEMQSAGGSRASSRMPCCVVGRRFVAYW